MAVVTKKVTFACDVSRVWDIVTSLEDYAWRSDLSRIEIINESRFVEYTKEGYATTFTVTKREPYRQWEFDMENANMKGHWTGIFAAKDGRAEVEFTEEVFAKKTFMKPFVKSYLKKQQAAYLLDLTKKLESKM